MAPVFDDENGDAGFVYLLDDLEVLLHQRGGRPIEGSSIDSAPDLAIGTRPMATVCCSPPDNVPGTAAVRVELREVQNYLAWSGVRCVAPGDHRGRDD